MNSELVLARIEALPEESRQLLLALVDFLAEKTDASPQAGQKHVFKPIVLIGFVFSGAVGVVFGCVPARKAARLNLIEALRHE